METLAFLKTDLRPAEGRVRKALHGQWFDLDRIKHGLPA